jgi:hypothetical protein
MKRLFSVLLLLTLLFTSLCSTTAYAVGDGNVDNGGGGMGQGTSTDKWSPGNEGVRVTVVRASDHAVVTTPIDLTNKRPDDIQSHFGKVSKLSYTGGSGISPSGSKYSYVNPAQALPTIISSGSGNANIEAIKSYFTDEQVIRSIAGMTGMDFDTLVGGDYKLLIEPIAYITFQGVKVAMTATESALYDEQVGGLLRSKMVSLSHKNLPLAMFLEVSDLGYPAWSGSRSSAASDSDIKSSLGLGVVRFKDMPTEPPEVSTDNYKYRLNTEVITSVTVSGGQSDPDNPVSVTFYIGGSTSQGVITAKIVDLDQNEPPNPVADDRNDNYTKPSVPSNAQVISSSWGVWRPWWHAYWVWHSTGDDSGYWCDHGWWEFDYDRYHASLSASMSIKPDDKNSTASGKTMKSGYGINQTVTANVSTNQSSAVTGAQNAVTYIPEFQYKSFSRLLDRSGSSYSPTFEFKKNEYSTYNCRTHFTPIWMPDGSYTPYTWLIDCWTPTGMLSMNLTDSVTISGNLWTDWHISPQKPK